MCECTYLECEHHNYGVASQARLCEPPSAAAATAAVVTADATAAAATAAVVTADARGVDGARSISSTCGGDHREIGGGKSQIDGLNEYRAAESSDKGPHGWKTLGIYMQNFTCLQ